MVVYLTGLDKPFIIYLAHVELKHLYSVNGFWQSVKSSHNKLCLHSFTQYQLFLYQMYCVPLTSWDVLFTLAFDQ